MVSMFITGDRNRRGRVKNVESCELPMVQRVRFGAVGIQTVGHRRNGEPPARWSATMPNFIGQWCYRMFPLIWL